MDVSAITRRLDCANNGFQKPYLIVAITISGIAGVAILTLNNAHQFGPMGTTYYNAAKTVGGAFLGVTAIEILWLALGDRKKTQPASSSNPNSGTTQIKTPTPIAPINSEGIKKYEKIREAFYESIERLLANPSFPKFQFPDTTSETFKQHAKEAFRYFTLSSFPITFKRFAGGEHRCVATDEIKGVLFKQRSQQNDMKEYVERAQKARKICHDFNLYLLYVPKCAVIAFDNTVVMEEKIDLLEGDFRIHKAYYRLACQDPKLQTYAKELQTYAKELFRQLGIFICKMKFSDVKYDNLLLSKDGRIALFDLDENSAVTGLTHGGAKSACGLFNMLPLEWFDEILDEVKKHLTCEEIAQLEVKLPVLREKAQKREERLQQMKVFYQQRAITFPTQHLTFKESSFEKYGNEVAFFAEKAIEFFNLQIKSLPHPFLASGRKAVIQTNTRDPFFLEIVQGIQHKKIWYKQYKEIEKNGLEALKEQGFIFSYKINPNYNRFSVIC